MGHDFWAIYLLGHVLTIQITKNHHHFNQDVCEYLMKKIIYQKTYLVNVMVFKGVS
jgi:hypothetical protein